MGFDGILTSVFIPFEISPDTNLMKKTLRTVEIRRHAKCHRREGEEKKKIIYLVLVTFLEGWINSVPLESVSHCFLTAEVCWPTSLNLFALNPSRIEIFWSAQTFQMVF